MQKLPKDNITIRDSIHGTISVNSQELALIDHPAMQRLRFIKQVGFIDLAFPGANHSRYAHSLGAMHMATRIFDTMFASDSHLDCTTKSIFRQALRLATLCHDIGHGPLSHSSEALMPNVEKLKLSLGYEKNEKRQATHEDFSLKILTDSSFAASIDKFFSDDGISSRHVVDLIFSQFESKLFIHKGVNYRPVLQQIVSSECDADRMDYLQRDSIYCGVNYGKFDADWLVQNLLAVKKEEQLFLGLRSRAIFTFEDFLLSRYHMFASVYHHHTAVIFDTMLELHSQSDDGFELPTDIEEYIQIDDIELWSHLRKSKCPWANRIVQRRPFFLIDEVKIDSEGQKMDLAHDRIEMRMKEDKINIIRTCSKSLLSKYFDKGQGTMFVVKNSGKTLPLQSYTPLYQRYKSAAQLHRLFVQPEHKDNAAYILNEFSEMSQ